MKVLRSGHVVGWQKDCRTGVVTEKLLKYEIQNLTKDGTDVDSIDMFKPHPKRIVFQLLGGPTGYESFVLVNGEELWDPTRMLDWGYWSACAGTGGRWDALRITAAAMKDALTEYLPENQKPHPLHGQEAWAIGIEHKPGEFGMTHGPIDHIAWMLEQTGEKNSCIIHFFGDGTEEITHRWMEGGWVSDA